MNLLKHFDPLKTRAPFLVAMTLFLLLACALAPPRAEAKTPTAVDKMLGEQQAQTKLLQAILKEAKAQTKAAEKAAKELETIRRAR